MPTSAQTADSGHAVHQRVQREQEPVEFERGRGPGEVGRTALAEDGLHQRQQAQHRQHRQRDRPRRLRLRLGHALHMDPHQQQRHQRHADVDEDQQREQPVADALGSDEVADQCAAEAGQPVEPLEAGLRDELRQLVPRQHVAVGAGHVDQPDQQHAGDPGEPAKAAQAVEREMAQRMHGHRRHQRVRGIAMHAAQYAAGEPLAFGEGLHRPVRALDAGVEERVQVQPAGADDPEQEEDRRAEVVQRVELVAEGAVEQRLGLQEAAPQQRLHGRGRIAPNTTTTNSSPPTMAISPPRPIRPMPAISPALRSTCSPPATLRCTP